MDAVIRFHLNDERVEERQAAPTQTLLWWLRRERGMTGTKEGCAEGDCGACTVAIVDDDPGGRPTFRAVNSCLVLLPMMHGKRVYTVEGLARDGEPHRVQAALTEALGSQCGYCTPGFVMSLFEGCYREDLDAPWKLDDQLCGNLCRCTGYRPIRDALGEVAGERPDDRFRHALESSELTDQVIDYQIGEQRFVRPGSFDALFDIIEQDPDHRFVSGATDLGLDVTKKRTRFACLVSPDAIPGMRRIERIDGAWSVGAAVRLSDLEAEIERGLPPLARMLRFFGSRQIKNRATLGGNICNASPIGDTSPVLLALGASVIARSRVGTRRIPIDEFFVGYRQTALRPGEVVARVEIPEIPDDARAGAYKVSRRRELDISAVAAGLLVRLAGDGVVTEARFAYGGMAATPRRATQAEAAVVGRVWEQATVEAAMDALADDFTPLDDHRGSAWYRATVARNLLLGFYEETRDTPMRALPDRPVATVLVEGCP